MHVQLYDVALIVKAGDAKQHICAKFCADRLATAQVKESLRGSEGS